MTENDIKKFSVDLPEYLHKKLKLRSAETGKKMKDFVIELLEQELN